MGLGNCPTAIVHTNAMLVLFDRKDRKNVLPNNSPLRITLYRKELFLFKLLLCDNAFASFALKHHRL